MALFDKIFGQKSGDSEVKEIFANVASRFTEPVKVPITEAEFFCVMRLAPEGYRDESNTPALREFFRECLGLYKQIEDVNFPIAFECPQGVWLRLGILLKGASLSAHDKDLYMEGLTSFNQRILDRCREHNKQLGRDR